MLYLFRMSEPSNKDDPKIISSNKDDTNIDESTRMIVNEIFHEIHVHEPSVLKDSNPTSPL